MSLYTQVPAKTLLSIYRMYPQGYQYSLLDKELISLLLSSKEKYHFSNWCEKCHPDQPDVCQ